MVFVACWVSFEIKGLDGSNKSVGVMKSSVKVLMRRPGNPWPSAVLDEG